MPSLPEHIVEEHKRQNIELCVLHNKGISEKRQFRQAVYVAALTLVTIATPFGKEFAVRETIFWIGYTGLFISTVVGILITELELRFEVKKLELSRKRLQRVEQHYTAEEPDECIDILAGDQKSNDVPLTVLIESWIYAKIGSLTILCCVLFISLIAYSLVPADII